jgi:hypothetical protein
MKEKNKKEYDAPMVEQIEARVEKGFQTSGIAPDPQTTGANETLGSGRNHSASDFD